MDNISGVCEMPWTIQQVHGQSHGQSHGYSSSGCMGDAMDNPSGAWGVLHVKNPRLSVQTVAQSEGETERS